MYIFTPDTAKRLTHEDLLIEYGKLYDEQARALGNLNIAVSSAQGMGALSEEKQGELSSDSAGRYVTAAYSPEEARKLTPEQLLDVYTKLHEQYVSIEKQIHQAVRSVDEAWTASGREPSLFSDDSVEWTLAIKRTGLSDNDFY